MYITHGSNKAFVELLKQLLKIGELEAVVSVQHETAAVPIPEKVIGDMRQCGAAIIHVDAERTVRDADDNEIVLLNENVLIEIGAAMALYGKRFILLVREGLKLPSNLQGLSELRYTGETLDAATALKLLEAITDIKNRPLP
jgi:predicted nucleotide-binding protein